VFPKTLAIPRTHPNFHDLGIFHRPWVSPPPQGPSGRGAGAPKADEFEPGAASERPRVGVCGSHGQKIGDYFYFFDIQ
jgi:hypothetical protein